MDPMIDLDRELTRSTQVDPSPGFTARVRSRIAENPRPSRWNLPRLALAAASAVAIGVLAASVVPLSLKPNPAPPSPVLEHHHLTVVAPLASAPPAISALPQRNVSHIAARMSEVEVSRSEMLALQQLFSGAVVAPVPGAIPDDMSIPELAIDAIDLPTLPEGERQ